MKKLAFAVLTLLLLGNLNINSAQAMTGTTDAKCSDVGSSGYKEVGFEAPDEQTFTPTYDRFTGVDIIVGGHMWGVDGINFTLYNSVGTAVGNGTIAPTINGGPTVRSWEPASPISVRKGVTYRLRVENPNTADFVWYTGNNECYSGGNARQKNANQNFDFGFTTYGFDVATATPASTSTPAIQQTVQSTDQNQTTDSSAQTGDAATEDTSNTSLNAGSSAGSGDAPATSTSSSIVAPAELKVIQSTINEKPILVLNWTMSKTADIEGYKVFKSENEKTGFKNISKLGKTTIEFKDSEVEVGKTYYYQVRAYKASEESKSSNTASKLVEVVTAPSSVALATVLPIVGAAPLEENTQTNWWPLIIIIILLIIAAIVLYVLRKWPFNKIKNSKININGGGMAEQTKKGLPIVIWVVVAIVVIVAALAIWFFTRSSDTETTSVNTEKAAITIPDGWQGFTSSKYHFSLSYPSDYTLTESAVGTIKLTKGDTELIDMYVYAANGDEAGMMNSQEALYTDDAKGYMIMDSVVQDKIAGFDARTITGKFGKNAGVSQTHEGVNGSTAFFATDDKLFVFDSYDNGDATAQKTFTDLLGTISF